ESGGAAIQASHIMHFGEAKSSQVALHRISFFQGFGFLRNLAIFPHFGVKLGLELCQQSIDENPGIVGLGIDNDVAVIVRNGDLEVLGKGEAVVLIKDKSVRKFIPATRLSIGSLSDSATARGKSSPP